MVPRSWDGPARVLLFASIAAFAGAARPASAQTATAAVDSADEQGTPQPPINPPTEAKRKADKFKLHWQSASVDYGKKFRLYFRAKFRGETRASDAEVTKEVLDQLDIPRRRIGFDGRILEAVRFKVDRELDSHNHLDVPTDPWRDVYIDVTQLQEAQFRYGQFKMPFSLEENTGSQDLDFAYRSSTANLLAPGRAKGWMVHGDTADRFFGYEYGVFTTDGNNALIHTSEKRVNAGQTSTCRVTFEPLRRMNPLLADVHFGYGKTGGDVPEGESGIKGRTVLGADFYKPDFLVNGRRERTGFEFQWRPGPASIKMEEITLTEERKGESVYNTDLAPYQVKGWYVSGSYAVTGESKARGLDRPNRPLFQGGFGALEAAVRVEKLTFGSGVTGVGVGSKSPRADVVPYNEDKILTFGVNWYPNRWIKIQMSTSTEQFLDPSIVTKTLRPTPNFFSRVLRVQFSI